MRRLPQRVFNSYFKAYNKRYEHSGTLFERPYRVKPVDTDEYLLHLCRYIHANAAVHGLVKDVSNWPYSNYPQWVGQRQGTLVDTAFVRDHFPAAGQYRAFVLEWLEDRRLPEPLAWYLLRWDG